MKRDDDLIQLHDIIAIFRRNFQKMFLVTAVCGGLGIGAGYVIPPRFKATAVVNIQSSYFETPMVNDLIASVRDPGEQNARRGSLLRLSLSQEFLTQLGEKHGLFEHPADHPLRTVELEELLKRIEYFSVSPTNFQISVGAGSAIKSYEMTKEVLERMISTLYEERYSTLVRTQLALKSNLRVLNNSIRGITSPAADQDVEGVRQQLQAVNTEIEILQNRFSPQHPKVIQLKEQAEQLQAEMDGIQRGGRGRGASMPRGIETPTSEKSAKDLYDELLRKLNFLNIVIEMEKDPANVSYITVVEKPVIPAKPFSPKKRVLAGLGLVGGVVLSLILAVFFELRRGTFAPPEVSSRNLDVAFLGVLPALPDAAKMAGHLTYQATGLLDGPPAHPPAPGGHSSKKKKG
ncbi:MAG: hypothetical protein IT285_01350 [Bdellovibrionales bacterium]|nr:hypothetical protein [Bdellovibrionales bacterium]